MSGDGSATLDTLLVGVDGASTAVLESLFETGELPNLQAVFDDGLAGSLTAQLPPWTPSAWSSLYTGVNPGGHGAFDFLAFDGDDWEPVDRSHVREHAIWELLARGERRSVVVNVPVTAPPPAFDGALVPGYVGAAEPPCQPEGLLADLRSELGAYRVYKPTNLDREERVAWYERLTRMRGRAFRHLVERFGPDFGFLQFRQTDAVFHELPEDREAVRRVFAAVDEEVGTVLEACDPSTVVVVSAHGIGPCEGPTFHVNEFLRDLDLVRTTRRGGGMPPESAPVRSLPDGGGSDPTPFGRLADAIGVAGRRFASLLERLGLRVSAADRAGTERVDFDESIAYMRSRTEMGVRINLAGRDENGTVSPAEYPVVRDDLIDELAGATTPAGDPVFDDVLAAETVFHGPHAGEAVDVLLVPAGFDVDLSASLRGEQFGDSPEGWNHNRDGVIAAVGERVDTDTSLGNAHLLDVAPTVLSMLDVPPSTRMDGHVLPFADPVDSEAYPPFAPPDADAAPGRTVTGRPADGESLEERGDR